MCDVDGPMRLWAMTATDNRGSELTTGHVLKRTTWMTNRSILASILKGACSNLRENRLESSLFVHDWSAIGVFICCRTPRGTNGVDCGRGRNMLEFGPWWILGLHEKGARVDELKWVESADLLLTQGTEAKRLPNPSTWIGLTPTTENVRRSYDVVWSCVTYKHEKQEIHRWKSKIFSQPCFREKQFLWCFQAIHVCKCVPQACC